MNKLDFDSLCQEVLEKLRYEKSIVLSTASGNKVTARTMSHVNDELKIMAQTGGNSEKVLQIRANPNVAFAISNIQIEAVAVICGHPLDAQNHRFIELYMQKFPQYFEKYTNHPDEVLLSFQPVKITFYKYIDGEPRKDILDVVNKKAYRTTFIAI